MIVRLIEESDAIANNATMSPQGKSTNLATRGSRRGAAAIVFSYDHGHMFCALDDVFAKFVTAITGSA